MGYQIIRQPDCDYAVFSSETDTWVFGAASRQEVIDFFALLAFRNAEAQARQTLDRVDDDPRRAYYQFTMTFEEANELSIAHGGEDLREELDSRAASEPPPHVALGICWCGGHHSMDEAIRMNGGYAGGDAD